MLAFMVNGGIQMPRKKIKKVEPIGETIRMQKGFSNRFNVPIVKSDRLHFKHRCITSIGVFVTWLSQEQIDDATTCMARLLGVHLPIAPDYFEKKIECLRKHVFLNSSVNFLI